MEVLRESPLPGETESIDAVIVNTLAYALVIDRKTGKVKRKLEFEFVANSAGCSDGSHFYVGSVRGWFYAVRLSEGLVTWSMTTEDMITTAPKYAAGALYVASNDGNFYAVRPDLGRERRRFWQQVTDGPLTAGFAVAQVEPGQGACFVPSEDYRLYAYNSVSGKTLWTFRARARWSRRCRSASGASSSTPTGTSSTPSTWPPDASAGRCPTGGWCWGRPGPTCSSSPTSTKCWRCTRC